MTEYVPAARYRIEACAGGRCRPLVSMTNDAGLDPAAWGAEVAAALRDLAALLRARGEPSDLVVRDGGTGGLVGIRRAHP